MNSAAATKAARLRLVAPPARRPADRDDALRRVRAARRHVEGRDPRPADRFAYLKRVYD